MEDNIEIEETDVEIEKIDEDANAFLTTAVVFGTGALTGVLMPKIWRKSKEVYGEARDRLNRHKKSHVIEVVQEKTKKEK